MVLDIRFVLVETTHPGNIGAAARAIKNMGFTNLYLVSPLKFPHPEAWVRSCGAEDVLNNAVVVDSLQEAILDCTLVFGTSSRVRSLQLPLLNPQQCAIETKKALASQNKIAFLFGQERMGLTNEQLALCHYHLYIPCNPDFASLNLGAAVQIMAYELRNNLFQDDLKIKETFENVSMSDMEKFYQHLEQTLINVQFLDAENPRQLMRKLRRIFNRAFLQRNEINILRGILTQINKQKSAV